MSRVASKSAAAAQRAQQQRRILIFVSLAVIAIGIIVAIAFGSRVPQSASTAPVQTAIKVGDVAPEFAAATTAGPFDLAKNGGKPTLLEVFATWCPHCQRETAVLNRLYAQYGNKINLVAISGSPYGSDFEGGGAAGQTPETQADVVEFGTKFNVAYPIAFDPNLDVANKYLQGGFPTVVLIGADNKIDALRSGEIPLADLKAALDAEVAGKPPSATFGAST